MTDAERAFLQLMAELASDGLFVERPGVAERILDAFDEAIEAVRANKNAGSPEGHRQKASQQ